MAADNQTTYLASFLDDVCTPETERAFASLLTSPQGTEPSPLTKFVKNVVDSGWLATPQGRTTTQQLMKAGLATAFLAPGGSGR